MSSQAAPGQLELARQFVNTLDVETGADELESPKALASWLGERGLLPGGSRWASARRSRRSSCERRSAGCCWPTTARRSERDAIEALNEAISDATLSVSFDLDGRQAGAGRARGRGRAPRSPRSWRSSTRRWSNGTWSRLKACPADDCHWAFYDESKNRSGTWCDMAVCGNRAKVRAYRERSTRARSGS